MKKGLAFLAVFFAFHFVSAQTQPEGRYESLLAYFSQSQLPVVTSTQAWSGRCYKSNGELATPSILAFKKIDIPIPNDGPLFPSQPDFQMNMGPLFMTGDQRPERFDNLTPQDAWALRSFLNSQEMSCLKTDVVDGSLQSASPISQIQFQVRSFAPAGSNPYFILKAVALQDDGQHLQGETIAACYYFKKILE